MLFAKASSSFSSSSSFGPRGCMEEEYSIFPFFYSAWHWTTKVFDIFKFLFFLKKWSWVNPALCLLRPSPETITLPFSSERQPSRGEGKKKTAKRQKKVNPLGGRSDIRFRISKSPRNMYLLQARHDRRYKLLTAKWKGGCQEGKLGKSRWRGIDR